MGQSVSMDCGLCWGKSLSLTVKWRHVPSSEVFSRIPCVTHPCWGSHTPEVSASRPLALPDFFPSSSFSPFPQPTCLSSFLTTSPGFHILPSPPPPPASHTHTHTHTHTRICMHTQIVHKIICLICQARPTAPDSSFHTVRLFLRHSVQEVPDCSCSQPSPPTDLAAAVLDGLCP